MPAEGGFAELVAVVRDRFSFLEADYGFRVTSKVNKTGFELRYRDDLVGVIVGYQTREPWQVVVCRLVDGRFPSAVGEMRPDTELNCFDLDDILQVTSSSDQPAPETRSPYIMPTDDFIQHQALLLKSKCADILQGNFSVFPLLDQLVKDRARQIAFSKWGSEASRFGWSVE